MTWQDTGTYDGSRWQSIKLHYIGCPWHGKTQEHMMGADDSLENYIILGAHDMARHSSIWWEQMTVYKTTLYWVPMTWQDTGAYDGSRWQSRKLHYIACPWHGKTQEHMMGADDSLENYIMLGAHDMARHRSIWWEQMTVYKTTLYCVPMTWQDTGTYDGSRWQSIKLHYIACPWHGKTQEHMMGADDSLENYIMLGAHDMARHRSIWWELMTV